MKAMPEWTTQQNNAIDARGRNILVSAAAGSGKTAVLVERVIKLITDKTKPVEIDRLLIVTFTNAAAAEMRSRISKSLNELIGKNPDDEFFRKQLSLLPCADICTIDAFCMKLVKEYFYELNISRDIEIMDESEASVLQDEIIVETIDRLFEDGDEAYKKLVEAYTLPGIDKPLISIVKRLLQYIYAQPFPFAWLKNAVESINPEVEFENTEWCRYLENEIRYLIKVAREGIDANLLIADGYAEEFPAFTDTFNDDLSLLNQIENSLDEGWDALYELLNGDFPAFSKLPRTTKLDEKDALNIKANRDKYKGIITKSIPALVISTGEEYREEMEELYPQLKALYNLVKEVDGRLFEEKSERNAYSFADIEHFAIELLMKLNDDGSISDTDISKALREKYCEILVDEYQDTNEAQDLLFRKLSNGRNLFTVGDMKQSIYRFRLAMPNIFNEKRKAYPLYDENADDDSSKIILDKNFRSRKGICEYVNFVFSHVMTERVGELEYTKEEFLNFNPNSFEENGVPCAKLCIIDNNKGENSDTIEAEEIAKLIRHKVQSGEMIQDKNGLRPVRYGDFVILMRSLKKYAPTYSEALRKYRIPVISDNSSNLFENNEIKMLLSLLRTVNNPTDSISLLATMMSPFYGFSADELARIKANSNKKSFYKAVFSSDDERVLDFIRDINELKKVSVTMSMASFTRYVIEQKGLVAFVNAFGNGEQRYQNIVEFIKFAKRFDSGVNVGLTAFVKYINSIIESDRQVDSASFSAGSADAVTIMSVHHSKGLEFPICILAGASRRYNKSELTDNFLLNTKLGVGMKGYDEKGMYRYKTLPYHVIANKNDYELMSENLRVLYVAMTRAKEQFISFISVPNLATRLSSVYKHITDGCITPYSVQSITNDGDLLLMCSMLHKDGKALRDIIGADCNIEPSDFEMSIDFLDALDEEEDSEDTVEMAEPDDSIVKLIEDKLQYCYERSELMGFSAKLTASSLDDAENNFEYITSSKPAFINKSELTPAQRGTAMHEFMQYADYEKAKANLESEIERCLSLGYLSKEQAASLDRKKLTAFFESELYKRMSAADNVYREIKVSDFFRACDVYDTNYEDKILIQGIADCVFEEDGKLVLVDYKTDSVKDENELLGRYEKQISFYKESILKMLSMEVKESLLYSFSLNKCCYYK